MRILYGVDFATDFLLTIDIETGAGTIVGELGGTFDRIEGLTFDTTTRTLFGVQRDLVEEGIRIARIDTETGLAKQIGPVYYGIDGRAIAYIPGLPDATAGEYYAAASADEDVFEDADAFDITRAQREDVKNQHRAFGIGEHFCLGSHLARLELKVIFEEMLKRVRHPRLDGEINWLRSNFIHGIKSMPIAFDVVEG